MKRLEMGQYLYDKFAVNDLKAPPGRRVIRVAFEHPSEAILVTDLGPDIRMFGKFYVDLKHAED